MGHFRPNSVHRICYLPGNFFKSPIIALWHIINIFLKKKTIPFGPILKNISQNWFLGEKVETTQLLNISNCAS